LIPLLKIVRAETKESLFPLLKAIRTETKEPLFTHMDEVVHKGKSVKLPRCEVKRADGGVTIMDVSLKPYWEQGGGSHCILFIFRESAPAAQEP
jgi:hypothetical protein